MADYMCKHCKFNNNGWCVAKRMNGLSKVLECESFKQGKYGDFKTDKAIKSSDVIYEKAVNKFGLPIQIDIAIEEMSELIQALSKYKRGKDHNVEEEIADVKIMIKQLETKFDSHKIEQYEEIKLHRLGKLINS